MSPGFDWEPTMKMQNTLDRDVAHFSGWLAIGIFVVMAWVDYKFAVKLMSNPLPGPVAICAGAVLVQLWMLTGLTINPPNHSRVFIFLGVYQGTLREAGFYYVPFWYSSETVDTRAQTLETEELKVNEKAGNPINAAAVIVWRVNRPASSVLDVASVDAFVKTQAEGALRTVVMMYPYENFEDRGANGHEPAEEVLTLRNNQSAVAETLQAAIAEAVSIAGVEILDARLSKLSYAPEIASIMLMRQQAEAMISARRRLAEGVADIVKDALTKLADGDSPGAERIPGDKRAMMANNLMCVLLSGSSTQPVINVGAGH